MNAEQILKQQKLELATAIRMATDPDELLSIRGKFELVRPWWRLSIPGTIAATEIRLAIKTKATDLRWEERNYLENTRKNCRTRNSTEKAIRTYTDIICSMDTE